MALRRCIALMLLCLLLGGGIFKSETYAQNQPPVIDEFVEFESDDALTARVLEISHKLRCPICQGQSIAESDAPIAKRLRRLVADQLRQGKNEEQVIADIVARYGDFVSFKPPLNVSTLLLWTGPALVLALMIFLASRRMKAGGG